VSTVVVPWMRRRCLLLLFLEVKWRMSIVAVLWVTRSLLFLYEWEEGCLKSLLFLYLEWEEVCLKSQLFLYLEWEEGWLLFLYLEWEEGWLLFLYLEGEEGV
jgi:hypothetical protein